MESEYDLTGGGETGAWISPFFGYANFAFFVVDWNIFSHESDPSLQSNILGGREQLKKLVHVVEFISFSWLILLFRTHTMIYSISPEQHSALEKYFFGKEQLMTPACVA